MYQCVFYDHQTYMYYVRDDKKGWNSFKYQQTFYKRLSKYEEGAFPILTGGWSKATTKYSKDDINLLERDINKELLILRDLYYKNDESIPEFQNITYLDIEIEMGGALTMEYIKSAPMPLTAISLLDVTTKQKICFIVDKSKEITEINEDGKIIIPCVDEEELCYKFLDKWEELDPTICITYNGQFFDIPYLYFRMKQVIGESDAVRLSPIKRISVQDWNPKELVVRIGGINHLDYMLLFKKYITKQEPSYKLNDLGLKYVDLGKIVYEGNLNQLFKRDKETFIDYNIRDVEILEKLEEKLKFIELTILISHICSVPYEQIYQSTSLGEGAILKYLKRENIVSPNKPNKTNPNLVEETYAGGYLLDPVPGLYYECCDEDLTSLYPSIIKSLNIGIESLVGRIKVKIRPTYEQNHSLEKLKLRDPNEIIIVEKLNKATYKLDSAEIKLGKLLEILEENNYSISASGAFYDTETESISSKILKIWFEKREHFRELKKKAGKSKDWDKYKLYDLYQHAFKILQNGHYGTYAKVGWRYTDGFMICSAAITNCGKRVIQESMNFVNGKLSKEFPERKTFVFMSDTDSLYIELKDIIKKRYGIISDVAEKNKKIITIAQELQNEINTNLNVFVPKLFNVVPENHYFQFKQEIIAETILATGKRRYGMWVTNKEGVEIPVDHKDALDLKGLELMKSNMNPLFKTYGENFIKNILFKTPKSQLDKSITDFHKTLKTIEPKKLGKPMGVSFIDKCIKSQNGVFSELNINTKENSRAAIYYNDLLRHLKLDKTFESVIEGDKIYIINLKSNPYNIDVVGAPNAKMPEEIEQFIRDYIDIEHIFESLILNKLKALYEDIGWDDFPSLNPFVSKFFVF